MTIADLVSHLDEKIEHLTEPLFERHTAGDESARDTARQLGLHLLDRGCSIVARSGLPLAGLDTAVVAAQDRAYAISAEQTQRNDELPENLSPILAARLQGLADSLGSTSVELYHLVYLLNHNTPVLEEVADGGDGC